MSLAFRDFVPRQMSPSRKPGLAQWESLASVVERANQWLAAAGLRAVNVETVVLPAANAAAPNSANGGLAQRWDEDHAWVQVVRVWHEVPLASPPPATMS